MKYKLAIGILLLSYCLNGQQLNVAVNQIHELKDLSIDNHIKCLSKDKSGNLWIGADNGLYRYNGKDVDKINISYVKDMILTRQGDLYVLSDAGLYEIQTTPFDWTLHHLIPSRREVSDTTLSFPKTIYQDISGNIWIGENQAIIRYLNGTMKRFPIAEQNVGNYLRHSFTFAEDGFGTLWTLSFNGDLYRYDRMNEAFVEVILPIRLNEASELSSDEGNKLWIGSISGIFEATLGENHSIQGIQQISDLGKIASISINEGYAWVSSFEKGLYQFNVETYGSIKLSTFENLDILDIFQETDQVWLAGSESIFVINSAPFYTFPLTLNQFVPTLQQVRDNSFVLNLGRKCYRVRRSPQGMQFESLFESDNQLWANDALIHQQELWMATSLGVYVYDLESKELTLLKETNQNSWLNTIYRTSDGCIWVSNQQDEALIKIAPDRSVHTYLELTSVRFVVENEEITYLAGEEGVLYACSEEGDYQAIPLDFALPKPDIFDMAFTSDSIFLATEKGIFTVGKSQLIDPTVTPHLKVAGNVESIAIDQDGVVWFAHPKGLSKLEKGEQVTFNRSQGLPSQYIVQRGLLIDANNQLWVCTSKGLATLTEGTIGIYQTPKPALVTCISNNQDLPVKDYNLGSFFYNSAIGLDFLSMAFPANSVQYRARLMQDDQLVKQEISDGTVSFFGLEIGDYTLQIQAKQPGAKWSDPVAYTFTVVKKWHQTSWFILLIASILVGMIYLIIGLYNRNLRQTNEKLELLVKERTASLENQKNELLQNQQQIVVQQRELINKNEVLSETQKALTNSEIQFLELKRDQMRRELELKTKQLTTHALSILQKNQYLLEISQSLDELGNTKGEKEISSAVRKMSQHIRNSIKQDQRWDEFRLYFEQVHADFYAKLKLSFPKLTNQDLKQCALVKLNLSLEDSATILGVSSESVRISRYRIQKKMGMSSQAAFYEYLVKL